VVRAHCSLRWGRAALALSPATRNLPLMERQEAASSDVLTSPSAGGRVIRGSALRVAANLAGIGVGVATAALLLRHLGVAESGRYVTVMSLVAIAGSVGENGLNVSASPELALRAADDRRALLANILGQRLAVTPLAALVIVLFAALAGYPGRMVAGTALAGAGMLIMSLANALLLSLTVELRNAELAFVDFFRQVATLAGVAVLVALGARLLPFFAVQIAVGLAILALVPVLVGVGSGALVRPRFDQAEQRTLLSGALPVAAAVVLGQLYFRLVIVLMSLISTARQTGFFGGSLRAMETLVNIPIFVAGVALPLLAAAARDDRARLRYAVAGLSEGAIVAGVLVVLVTVRAAEPVMEAIGGASFRPAGDVLRIQVAALLFIALYQIWTVSLIALGRRRDLILTNSLGLFGVGVFAVILVPLFGARGGASASVAGDALLASLIYWRLRAAAGAITVRPRFLARVAAAALIACVPLLISTLPDLLAAALAGALFLAVGLAIGMLPEEVRATFGPRGLLARRSPS
jgi:O-antigen/teichoic acid export membrane protein